MTLLSKRTRTRASVRAPRIAKPTTLFSAPRFAAVWSRAAATALCTPQAMYAELEDLYSDPVRHFHTAEHVSDCLVHFDNVAAMLLDRDAVELALWFHDAIYEPGAADNERRSAKLFVARTAGVDDLLRRRVCALVLATRHAGHVQGHDRRFMVDIDLAGFGAPWDEFMAKGTELRNEYAAQSDECYYAAQLLFLKRLRERRQFFTTAYFRDRYEATAQENLRRLVALRVEQGYGGG